MAERHFSSHEVSALLQATPSAVIRWIDSGQLRAYRTPGGHRRVRAADLIRFLQAHGMPIPPELSAPRFLLVDDDARFRRAWKRELSRSFPEAEIETCANGIEALLAIGVRRPEIVVLDVFMPDLDGVEVCRRIKANPATAEISVIAVTGRPSAALERRLLEAGAAAMLSKPFRGAELASAIERTRQRRGQERSG